MGVPVFFKWLSMRNPKIVKDAIEPEPDAFTSGNPAIDNFYIDMNGLIHPSCNPRGENIKVPKNFEEQCENIYDYIDKLINIVRPRKTLYLAIDGVAPRAKMNQQRSRRFRAAMEGEASQEKKLQVLQKFKNLGAWSEQLDEYVNKKSFESNMITPGTEFLSDVCVQLREYIKKRLQHHKLWKNLIVVFSDANCPGEGEHKIMDFVRQQRSSEGYNPNQSHCIYGADADLIMLGLATHEPRFYIIRQIVITANDKFCTSCQKRGHYFMDCVRATSIEDEARVTQELNAQSIGVSFQFIRLQMVREYIHINYMKSLVPFGYNLERIIDDFIFLCFFVGNDFLPHVPCLSIREGGIDVLMKVYDYCLALMPGYLTDAGELNLPSLRIFIDEMKHYEGSLVDEMIVRETNTKQRDINNRIQQEREKAKEKRNVMKDEDDHIDPRDPIGSFKAQMEKLSKDEPFNLDSYSVFGHNVFSYKEKYYKEKFKITAGEFLELKSNLSRSFIEALRWVCAYYYRGVPSWSWYYPFNYSPFFTDIAVPDGQLPDFEPGTPFRPFEQLMAVLPPRTCSALPTFLHYYMKDTRSPIIDYYPSDFVIDLVGKKFAWLGEVILPFIDDKRLLAAMGDYQSKLSAEEAHRNRFGIINVYISRYGNLGRKVNKSKAGDCLMVKWENQQELEGELTVMEDDGEVISYCFAEPNGRKHSVQLKQGIHFNVLEEIDDQFISRTDRAAFGGIRYIKVIERVLAKRKQNARRQNDEEDNEDREDWRHHDNNRKQYRDNYDRSREKRPRDRQEADNSRRYGREGEMQGQSNRDHRERRRDEREGGRRESGEREGGRRESGERRSDHFKR